jgi:hypothetical protein
LSGISFMGDLANMIIACLQHQFTHNGQATVD